MGHGKASSLVLLIIASLYLATLFGQGEGGSSSPLSTNLIRNHSFEDGFDPLTGYPLDWGNWTKHGTPDSTITVDNTRAVDGSHSARLDVGEKDIGFIAMFQTLPFTLRFGNLSDRPDGLDFWFYLEQKYDGLGDFRVRVLFGENIGELNYVFDPDPLLAYPNITDSSGNPLAVSIFLNGYSAGVWHHFQRNLRADWQASGFSLDTPFPRIQFDALTFRNIGTGQSFAEIAWVDNVRLYADGPGTGPPTWPAGSSLAVTQVGTTSLSLAWNPAQDDVSVVSYRIFRGNTVIATVGGGTLSYEVGGLSPGTTYVFKVEAGDAEESWSIDGPSVTVATTTEPGPELSIVGVWSNAYGSSDIIDTSLAQGDFVTVEINVTNAPLFNGYEFTLFYDPQFLEAVSFEVETGTVFDNPFVVVGDLVVAGTVKMAVVNLGGSSVGTGTLSHVTFSIKGVGVSPLTLAAGMAHPSSQSRSWTRLVLGSTSIEVDTSDGYFKNVAGKSGPVAEFTFSPINPVQGMSVQFDAGASFDPDNDLGLTRGIAQYHWNFDDGIGFGMTTPTAKHDFKSLTNADFFGNFSVRLTVVDSDGFQGMKTMIVEVSQKPLHDVQVLSLGVFQETVTRGENVSGVVVLRNDGTFTETFGLTVEVESTMTNATIVIANYAGQIMPNNIVQFQFTSDTSLLEPGLWLIIATVDIEAVDDFYANNHMAIVFIVVEPQKAHDVAVTEIFANTPVAVSGQIVRITVAISNQGLNPETLDVIAYYDSQIAGAVNEVQIPGPSIPFPGTILVTVDWNTEGVAPGTYTISASVFLAADEDPSDNTLTNGQVRIDPPPAITVSPVSGPIGTRTTVEGSGFPLPLQGQQFTMISISFGGVFVGSLFSDDGTFSFTFSLPHVQPGSYLIRGYDSLNQVGAAASFLVLPSSGLEVSVRIGEIYFRGDTVDLYLLASLDGSPVESSGLQIELSLIKPDGSTVVLQATGVSTGLFKASYHIPVNGAIGTYTVVARAHHPNTLEASTLRSFEVKPSWLQAQAPRIASAAVVAGLVALGTVAWRRVSIGKGRPPSVAQPQDKASMTLHSVNGLPTERFHGTPVKKFARE